MGKWLYDRPWIWIVVLLTFLVVSGAVVLVIAENNRPTIVKEKKPQPQVSLALEQVSQALEQVSLALEENFDEG